MSYVECIQKTIDYIEDNIKQPITTEVCAEVAGFSKYHFYRLFTLLVGIPLMEYVRKRRLSYAMKEVNKGRRIIDIALDFEYSSERAFSRAFQKEFGETPRKFRNRYYAVSQKPNLKDNEFIVWRGLDMEYKFSDIRIDKLDDMYVASSYVISNKPEEDVSAFMEEWMKNNNINMRSRQFGFDIPVSVEENQKGLRGYEYWVEVNEDTKVHEGVKLKKIEKCNYAVLRIIDPFSNPFESIPAGWNRLLEWVNEHEYELDKNGSGEERYWLEEKIQEGSSIFMDLYFPIN